MVGYGPRVSRLTMMYVLTQTRILLCSSQRLFLYWWNKNWFYDSCVSCTDRWHHEIERDYSLSSLQATLYGYKVIANKLVMIMWSFCVIYSEANLSIATCMSDLLIDRVAYALRKSHQKLVSKRSLKKSESLILQICMCLHVGWDGVDLCHLVCTEGWWLTDGCLI